MVKEIKKMEQYINDNLNKWIEKYKIKKEDLEIFKRYCLLAIKNDTELPNINTFILFKRLFLNHNEKFIYAIADEIIVNRTAIMSLDNHVYMLISEVGRLRIQMEKIMISRGK
ncbi:MAG: hypothetical protein A3K77_00470 [Euryarchaeota archaeon RBG_13_31_8]|nr:MAG: hypothetical protein A3K77_00470 [Euryarchaeota archaeon RBG_13_31_8]